MSYKNIKIPISKSYVFDNVLYSIVAQPGEENTDAQGDWWEPAEIRKAAFNFMDQSRIFNLNHSAEMLPDATLVESWVTKDAGKLGDEPYTAGSWLIGIKVSPEILDQVKRGEIGAVSIQGKGIRT